MALRSQANVFTTSSPPATEPHRFGTSEVVLSPLGFGAAPIGNLYQSMGDEQAAATVEAALLAGIRYYDSAPHYGFGLSETRLGQVLNASGLRSRLVISTKVGRLLVPTSSTARERHGFVDAPALEPVFDYSYDAVMRSFEQSLKRLQTDYVDIVFAHDLGVLTHGDQHSHHFRAFIEGGYRALCELKAAGLVKAIGLGANEWQVCVQALAAAEFDGFLLAGRYTLLEQEAVDSFLPLCAERGASVIVGGPFNSGILATGARGTGEVYYNYRPAPAAVIKQVNALEEVCDAFSVPLPAAALQFPAAHPRVCCLLAGFATPRQVQQANHWLHQAIAPDFWRTLRQRNLVSAAAPLPGFPPVAFQADKGLAGEPQ
ncbi:aldo/keto reductase [Cellvibrio japonicus]|uniref:aldo/keto reductase n=1 Tax=Cellvibrio japonicus TaxID=155077 RepID=UPI00032227DD|nr:aldo/keto reductase [Cellvibrio japonicus]